MAREDGNLAAVPPPATEGRAGEKAAAAQPRRYRYSEGAGGAPVTLALDMSPGGGPGPASPIHWQPIWLVLAAAGLLMVFLYPTDLQHLVARWISDAGWSHGFVVPLISAFFIRLKWDTLRELTPKGSLWGVAVILVGVCGQVLYRATGLSYMSDLSLLVVLFGMVLFVFGWQYMKILWLPIAYLGFAIPPPTPLYVMVTIPMQTMAAELGVQLLPLVGGEGSQRYDPARGIRRQEHGPVRRAGVRGDADAGGVFRAGGGAGVFDGTASLAEGDAGGLCVAHRDYLQWHARDDDGIHGGPGQSGLGQGERPRIFRPFDAWTGVGDATGDRMGDGPDVR